MMRFTVEKWAAWSPGLPDRQAWLDWLSRPVWQSGDAVPALGDMPSAMRRRADRLGRAALQVAYWCDDVVQPDCPLVFASRYGEMQRSLELLHQLTEREPLSPATFSMSVHNAVGALLSIARRDTGNYTAVAAGEETVEAAFAEAFGLLADGAPAVTVVYYDAPLPAPYDAFGAGEPGLHAWACRIRLSESGGYSLEPVRGRAADMCEQALSGDLAILHFLLSGTMREHVHVTEPRAWLWRRHG